MAVICVIKLMSLEEKYAQVAQFTGIPEVKLKELRLQDLEKIFRALTNTGQIKIKA